MFLKRKLLLFPPLCCPSSCPPVSAACQGCHGEMTRAPSSHPSCCLQEQAGPFLRCHPCHPWGRVAGPVLVLQRCSSPLQVSFALCLPGHRSCRHSQGCRNFFLLSAEAVGRCCQWRASPVLQECKIRMISPSAQLGWHRMELFCILTSQPCWKRLPHHCPPFLCACEHQEQHQQLGSPWLPGEVASK